MVRLSSLLAQGRKTAGPVSLHFQLSGSKEAQKKPHHCSKTVGDVDPGGVASLSWDGWVICKERS